MHQDSYKQEPPPEVIKYLIYATCGISLFVALTNTFIQEIFHVKGLQQILALSWEGLDHFYLWQPLTALFFYDLGSYGISFWSLFGFFFYMYILWVTGSNVIEHIGSWPFLRLYFFSGVLAGMATLIVFGLFGQHAVIAGPIASIFAILTCWVMLNPRGKIFLFLIMPLKASSVIASALAVIIFLNITNGNFTDPLYYLLGVMYGYFYGILAWDLRSPFPQMQTIDKKISGYSKAIRSFFNKKNRTHHSKIYDIHTGEPINRRSGKDERFMDEMLDKISKYGEGSLTLWEKIKLRRITKNRK